MPLENYQLLAYNVLYHDPSFYLDQFEHICSNDEIDVDKFNNGTLDWDEEDQFEESYRTMFECGAQLLCKLSDKPIIDPEELTDEESYRILGWDEFDKEYRPGKKPFYEKGNYMYWLFSIGKYYFLVAGNYHG